MAPQVVGRVLPPEEWAEKLAGTPLASLDPAYAVAVVVEVDGQVVARWAAINTVHLEGLQIDDAYHGHAGVDRALLSTMLQILNEHKVPEVLTNAETPEIEAMLEKIGAQRVPGTQWVLALQGGK